MKSLKNKKILITAGPTWVAIDKVRVISNIGSGQTGRMLAREAKRLGAKVTLIIGPVGEVSLPRGIKVIRFNFFDELLSAIRKELTTQKYQVVIHSAAVSDYRPKSIFRRKLDSGQNNLGLELSPTSRIVDKIKKFDDNVLLVAFKLEFGLSKEQLITEAQKLSARSRADLVVVNTFDKKGYGAQIIDNAGRLLANVNSKKKIVRQLLQVIKQRL